MTKSTLTGIYAYLNGDTTVDVDALRIAVEAEMNRNAEKAEANRQLYASAHDAVIENIRGLENVTLAEMWDTVENHVPNGFTKGKLQYAIREYWGDEFEVTDGSPKTYSLK